VRVTAPAGTRWVALLRGIAPMRENQRNDRLRAVCEGVGLTDVTSVLSSGNLVFTASGGDRSSLETVLEEAWPTRLGFRSTSILRTCEELATLVGSEPFGDREHGPSSYLLVTFAKGRLPVGDLPQPPGGGSFELLGSTGRELFTATDTTGAAGSPDTMAWLEATFGTALTSRTWRTVQRIAGRC
jgi:uncharacterized protein (DUF1697 family)